MSELTSHHLSCVLALPPGKELIDAQTLVQTLRHCVPAAGLACMADVVADFSPQRASACIILKESHVAAHVWPEHQSCTIDIHVCDYLEDNLCKAKMLAELLSIALAGAYLQDDWHLLTARGRKAPAGAAGAK